MRLGRLLFFFFAGAASALAADVAQLLADARAAIFIPATRIVLFFVSSLNRVYI